MKNEEGGLPSKATPASGARGMRFRPILFIALATVAAGLVVVIWMTRGPKIVLMQDSPLGGFFEPDKLTIRVGTTVRWQNVGHMVHDATNRRDLAARAGDVESPAGPPPFDSGFLPPGQTFSYTFTVPGTYKYVCVPHELGGMIGEVTVTRGWLW